MRQPDSTTDLLGSLHSRHKGLSLQTVLIDLVRHRLQQVPEDSGCVPLALGCRTYRQTYCSRT